MNQRWLAFGTHSNLYAYTQGLDTAYDITPVGFTAGSANAQVGGGYGSGAYGAGLYGAMGSDPGSIVDCTTWSLDTFGQYLVGCSTTDGKLYKWTLNTASPATAITATSGTVPQNNRALVVTSEGVIMALGAGGDPRRVQWCDLRDDGKWAPGLPSIAGSFPLQTPGKLMAGRRVRGGTLLFTEVDAHLATFNDPSNPYSFERVGSDCGVISTGSPVPVSDGMCAWMGRDGFFAYEGAVRHLDCEVSDYIFNDINRTQASKVAGVHNPQYAEVTWFYPSFGATENDRYVSWNYRAGHWTIGRLSRTCGVPKGVFLSPIMADASGGVWSHEVGLTYTGAPAPYIECAPVMLGSGDKVFTALSLVPDEKALGSVRAAFAGRLLPTQAEEAWGPYPAASRTSVRFTARQFKMRLEGQPGQDWRAGGFLVGIREGGRR